MENLLEARRTVNPAREWERTQQAGIRVYTWDSIDYPANLRNIDQPPPVLFARGRLTSQDEWAVALVGTRHATAYGREVAQVLGTALARNGITVASGLALGIDTVAHRAAVDAGGRTLAVLGSGVDQVYPAQNRALAEAVASQGALLSDYPVGTRPEAANFPPRNRIISGLSRGVVIVEAGDKSGALITARFAAEQGREVFAVPGSILQPGSAGCNALIRDGATPLLSVDELLETLNLTRLTEQIDVRQSVPADPQEQQMLACLSSQPSYIDDIVRASALEPAQVSGLLAVMELKGLVRQVGALQYVRA
jgi:DNA processing protein